MKPRKICKAHGCLRPAFSHEYCDRRDHQLLRSDSSFIRAEERREAKKKEPKKAISKQAPKRKKEKSEYSVLRADFFEKPENKMCRVYPWLEATDIHHMWGTENWRLLIVEWWLPVSRAGHDYIHDNPEEAFDKKWSYYRNQDIGKQISENN